MTWFDGGGIASWAPSLAEQVRKGGGLAPASSARELENGRLCWREVQVDGVGKMAGTRKIREICVFFCDGFVCGS